ncbi:uncharacterized protein LOC113432121, partial [Notechis scutatus]|uniref:Uncharacterized protein LOC113432121 n=1 Tax=Notechis scutatus TaxID=8663 RepID=A0A6J1W4P6_9SAUR
THLGSAPRPPSPGVQVLLVDQWVETGGTMQGAIQLVERQGGVVAGIAAICIEDSDGGRWLKSRYKWSHCVSPLLMPQFNAHQLDSFHAFRTSLPSQEQPAGPPSQAFEPGDGGSPA